ncbi:MAG: PKD domain-containing protein [Burkholderiaceae bacterium]|nr:PKD domain-containing protein [Burkholderiaceae bacterium]
MRESVTPTRAGRRVLSSIVLSVCFAVLSACGGGGGDSPPTPPQPQPAALPDSVSITTATAATDIEATFQFKPSNDTSVAGINYAWTFGDGGSSALPQPSYKYAKAGDYKVELKISNSAGQSRSATFSVSLDNKSHLTGLSCDEAQQGGWCRVYPKEQRAELVAVRFADAAAGWAVGEKGKILRTTDGGASWIEQIGGATVTQAEFEFDRVLIFDRSTAWAHSNYGNLHYTSDGGASWRLIGSSYVKVPGEHTKYLGEFIVQGRLGLIGYETDNPERPAFVSRDGGASWLPIDPEVQWAQPDGTLWRVDEGRVSRSVDLGTSFHPTGLTVGAGARLIFVAHDNQYLSVFEVGDGFYTLWRSRDGGSTWVPLRVSFPMNYGASKLYQIGPDAYLARLGGGLFRSVDGGQTFVAQPPVVKYNYTDVTVLSYNVIVVPTWLGAMISGDGGATWQSMNSPVPNQAFDADRPAYTYPYPKFQQIDVNTLISWGWPDNPGVYSSKDHGQSWRLIVGQTPNESAVLKSFLALTSTRLLAITDKGALRLSTDAGRTWATKLQGTAGTAAKLLRSGDGGTVWLSGSFDAWLPSQSLKRSIDGGDTWQELPVAASLYDFNFMNAKFGWARSATGMSTTRDGGESWIAICQGDSCPPAATALSFRDELNGVAVSRSTSYKTRDGGKTWTTASLPSNLVTSGYKSLDYRLALAGEAGAWASLLACDSQGSHLPWVCSTALLQSSDGGSTWARAELAIDDEAVNVIGFFDAQHGWVHTPNRRQINFTQDGGKTWTQRAVPFVSSAGIQFNDMRTGWMLNQDGELFATGTGGATVPPAMAAGPR